jgi:hypothetical protein
MGFAGSLSGKVGQAGSGALGALGGALDGRMPGSLGGGFGGVGRRPPRTRTETVEANGGK